MRARPFQRRALIAVPALLALLCGCAERTAPGATEYRPLPFRSQVTVTGGDVPGVLRVRDASLAFAGGAEALTVRRGEVVQVVLRAWINGHGEFRGHWERDGEAVDRVSVFITYGETMEVRLGGEEAFPTTAPGRHEVRFVIEGPDAAPQPAPVAYTVESPFG